MYIKNSSITKFIEAQMKVEKITVKNILEHSQKADQTPLTEKEVRHILNHPKQMEKRYGIAMVNNKKFII
jgi:hypothetical protein